MLWQPRWVTVHWWLIFDALSPTSRFLFVPRYYDPFSMGNEIPVSAFCRHLGDSDIKLDHFGIGSSGCRAVAEALRMNPPLQVRYMLPSRWSCSHGAHACVGLCLCLCVCRERGRLLTLYCCCHFAVGDWWMKRCRLAFLDLLVLSSSLLWVVLCAHCHSVIWSGSPPCC